MAVYSRRIQPLQVVEGNGWVDSEAKDTSPEEVPEAHSDEAVDGPLVVLDPLRCLGELVVVVGFHPDQYEGDDL